MASSATTRNRLEKQGTGENTNVWGSKLNTTAFDLIDAALDGRVTFTLSTTKTLSSTNYVADESRMRFIDITGGTGGTVTIPSLEKWYWVRNGASGSVIFTTGSGVTATVPAGAVAAIMCDATNVRLMRDQTGIAEAKAYALALAFSTQAGDYPDVADHEGEALISDGVTVYWGFASKPQETKTGAFTAALNGDYLLDSSGGTIAVTLPAATNSGETIRFSDAGSAETNAITITRAGSDTIGGDTTLVMDVSRAGVTLVDGSGTWTPLP